MPRRATQPNDGVLVVDKPSGPTSHDVVVRVRRAVGIDRIGHAGTLDPFATGVLALLVGRATRLAQFLSASDKEYDASIRLGVATDTYDSSGRPLGLTAAGNAALPADAAADGIDRRDVEMALERFKGTFLQAPPPFSAKKIGGVRAYTLARQQQTVKPAPVPVTVHRLEILTFDVSRVDVRLTCASGFYVRALAHELGLTLGCGAHLESLRRTRSGEFRIARAVPVDLIEEERRTALARLIQLRDLLSDLPAIVLTARGAVRAAHGNVIGPDDVTDVESARVALSVNDTSRSNKRVRLVEPDGDLLGIADALDSEHALHPVVVLR